MPVEYVLSPPVPGTLQAPQLDDDQRRVVAHPGGPLLVLAGPGAGKTTTLVEVVVDRVDNRGFAPEEILVLTFSRKAADELRSRIARRLGRTTAMTTAMTFHSFCYGLVRQLQEPGDFVNPLQLLSAPEQDAMIQRLLTGGDSSEWPAIVRPALRTRGLAAEMQRFIATARSLDMDAVDLLQLGEQTGREEWKAAARFFDDYAGVSALQNSIDYADLIFQAVQHLRDPETREAFRRQYRLVIVDEFQDTDPLQVELLQALAGEGRDVIAVGDPYQSIYGFRGADVRGILGFRDDFPRSDGGRADQIVLTRTSRYGATISAAVASIVSNRGVLGPVDGPAFAELRELVPRVPSAGSVRVDTFATTTAEAEHVALMLRESHLSRDIPWGSMAVLVRSGADLARFQRSLSAAGVPVIVAGDELPLSAEPAVRTLLMALRAADDLAHGRPLEPVAADALLSGPLGGLDAPALRRVGRALRTEDRREDRGPRASRVLLAEALSEPAVLLTLGKPGTPLSLAASSASRLAQLLRRASVQIGAGDSTEEVLWTLWSGTSWPERLRTEALGDGEGSARADHDLDVMCALFAQAARAEENRERRTLAAFVAELEAQQIPADTLAQDGLPPDAVQLMTAHRSKGLEWHTVVVAGVQDGTWPDVRHRGSFLRTERLDRGGEAQPPTAREALREERRLFYVACTRARTDLVVTAVESGREDGDQPSLFVSELWDTLNPAAEGVVPTRTPHARPVRPLSLRSSIAALRRLGESTESDVVRDRAARILAMLAERPTRGTGPAAPDRWWGLREITDPEQPMRDPEGVIRLSGSSVSAIVECPLRWFLDHEVKGSTGTTTAQGFGSVVHAVAAEVAEQRLPADVDALGVYIDKVWDQLDFAAEWIGGRERAEAREGLVRFVNWHLEHGRTTLAAEHEFTVGTEIDGHRVELGGSMDRVEQSDDGIHVVDLKTSKSPADRKDLAEHPQLGFYQLAVDLGATEFLAAGVRAAGAELVQLRNPEKKLPDYPLVQPQDRPPADRPFFAAEQLARSVRVIAAEDFAATPSDKACRHCQFQRMCPAKADGDSILDGRQP